MNGRFIQSLSSEFGQINVHTIYRLQPDQEGVWRRSGRWQWFGLLSKFKLGGGGGHPVMTEYPIQGPE